MTTIPTLEGFQAVGQTPAPTLFEARLQLHWAAQIAASVGYSLVEPTPDWSHTTLGWTDAHDALASQPTTDAPHLRCALRPADLTLLLLDATDMVLASFSLDGRTLDDGYAWLTTALATSMGETPDLKRVTEGLPNHAVAHGTAFSVIAREAFAELAAWYANADLMTRALQAQTPGQPPYYTWPHHLDTALLMEFDPAEDGGDARTIGVGLVPGDESYDEPYWYITPAPASASMDLPPLQGGGVWRTEGWFGAVQTASTIVAAGDAEAQAARNWDFIRSGVEASRVLLGLSD